MNIFHLSSEVKLEQLRHHDGYEHAMFYLGKGMKQLSKFGTLTAAKTRWELLKKACEFQIHRGRWCIAL